jgi:zinc protease
MLSIALKLADDGGDPLLPVVSVAQHQLGNGLQVLVQSDFSAPVVSLQFWCATGSIHEGRWLGSGLSHLLEHLMFKGTPKRGNSEMAQTIQDLGGHLNAYTSFDRTVYHVDLPSEGWDMALDVLADAMMHSLIPVDEFEKEKDVIRREFAMTQDNPDRELSKLVFDTAFTRHPYRFPVIGHLDLFNQLTRDDVLNYYRQRYSIQNLILVVCGAVKPEGVFAEAEKLCGSAERHPLPDVYLAEEPPQLAPRQVERTFPTQLTRLSLFHPIPGLHDADIPALDVLAILLGSGRSSRLHQVCVEKSDLAEEVDAFAFSPMQHGLWGIDARCAPEKQKALVDTLHREVERIVKDPPLAAEVERAKRLSLLHQLHSMKTMSGKASSIGRGWLLGRDAQFGRHFLERIQHVETEDIWRVARRYLVPSTENLVALIAEKSGKKSGTEVANVPKSLPVRKTVVGKDLRILSLSAGILPLVSFRATFGGGLLAEPEGLAGINHLATQMLIKGTRKRSAEQLSADIEQLGGYISSEAGNNSSTLGLELLARDWEKGLDILLEILTECSFTANELTTEKRKQAAALQMEMDYPMALARNLMRQTLYPGHPYAFTSLGKAETLEAITLDDVRKFAQKNFFNQNMILSVSGPVSSPQWQPMIEARLKSLAIFVPSINKETHIERLEKPVYVEQIIPKEQAVVQVGFSTGPLTDPNHIPLMIIDEAMSDLGSRLFIKIREDQGLAYFVGTSQFNGLADGYFVFYAGTDPEKRKSVEKILVDEIGELAARGLTEIEMNRARAKLLSLEKIESQNPSQVVYHSSIDELYGFGYDYVERRMQRLSNITLDEINTVAKKYFSTPGYAIVTVTPK